MRALTLYHTELRSLAEVPKADHIASSYVMLWVWPSPPSTLTTLTSLNNQGAVKGVYLKGLNAQTRLFYREMDCPVQWSLATPSALESQSRANQNSVVANPICKCRCHKAGHLQVRVALGRRSTCVLKEAPLDKGPLGLPQITLSTEKSLINLVRRRLLN